MTMILFAVSILASAVGAIAGFGGGVIIKPVLDALGLLPVSTISFLSGCTVLAMSVSSLIKNRNDGVNLNLKTSTPLALGSVMGGIIGKAMFQFVRENFHNENVLGFVQAVCLVTITAGVFVYVLNKSKVRSYKIDNAFMCVVIGTLLGIISSFLGIGGGTSNVAVLFFFFSMDAKEAAKNSIYIIMFSQIASIITAVLKNTVPVFEINHLIFMMLGGVSGGIIGSMISKRLDSALVEKLLKACLVFVILTNLYNVFKFSLF